MINKRIKEVLRYFLAFDENLSLEHRLFLSTVIIGIFLSLLTSIVSIIISSPIIVSIITLLSFFSLLILFYLGRVKKIFKPFIIPLIITSFIAIAILWITDGGINGSNLFVGFVILILGLIIVPDKNKKYIFAFFITLIIIIYLIQFYRPDLISDFTSETTRWIDNLITAIYSSFFLFLIIKFLHKNYTDEKHRAEESEKKFLSITENSADAIFITDQHGKYIYTNKAVSAMLGYSFEEMRNKTITDLSSPDKTERYFEDFKRILTEGRLFTELELLKKDGTYITTDLNAILLPEGLVYGSCRDITERKKSEEALSKQNKLFNTLLDNIHIGVYMIEVPSGKPLLANEASFKLLGRGILPEANSSTITKLYELYKSESNIPYPNEELPLVLAMSGVSKHVNDMFVVKPDGTKTDLEVFGSPVLDDNGNIWASLVSFQDITERKQANLTLKEREKEFRSLAESMPQIVWTTRADGWNTYFNQQWVDYTGLTLEESYGHGWNIPFHPEDKQGAWDAWQNAVNNHAEYSIECRLRCHDGTYHWWLIRGVPQLGADGEILKWFGTCTDIEKIKEAELALKDDEKLLLKLNADKDRFISILGHDLKGPFNNILGLSEILSENIQDYHKEEIEVIAKNINKSARITNKLLEDILTWSRAQQGSIAFKPQSLRLSNTCRNILEILNPGAYAKNITIHDSGVGNIDVYADIDMLKTILLNLVSNAIKFTNGSGKININAEQNSGSVTVSVSDNGVGIPSDNLSKLFDISEVLSTKGTAEESGTGLGLLLCKEFVEKHGGKIWVESVSGKGSDFKFTLPMPVEQGTPAF